MDIDDFLKQKDNLQQQKDTYLQAKASDLLL